MPKKQTLSQKHLLGIRSLEMADISTIFTFAEIYIDKNRKQDKKHPILKGRTLINLFFENSTRTRTSFELAGKRLGADVVNMQVAESSIAKGETLLDTAAAINAMKADFIVIRHPASGTAEQIAQHVDGAVINAGDGSHEHPTQALLDALVIHRRLGKIKGLVIAICGDILHSRVARSNILLLNKMGAKVQVIAPPTLMPQNAPEILGVEVHHTMQSGLKNADVVMMLRLQRERMRGCYIPSAEEYFNRYGLDYATLAYAKKNALVMHPGPINRGVEIDDMLADDLEHSVILEQVEAGVAVRQAALELLA